MTNIQFIRQYFADPVRLQCVNQTEVEDLAGVEHGGISCALTVDDLVNDEDLKAIVTVLKML